MQPPSHEELLADHRDLVLGSIAAHAIRELDLHVGGTISAVGPLLDGPLTFAVVIPAVAPALAPDIWILDNFVLDPTDRRGLKG
jgi:hypothetical protein